MSGDPPRIVVEEGHRLRRKEAREAIVAGAACFLFCRWLDWGDFSSIGEFVGVLFVVGGALVLWTNER